MTAPLSRAEILARRVHGRTERVDLGDGYVVVRGLTRGEAQETVGKEVRELEALIVWHGLVQPELDYADVLEWMDNDESGLFEPIIKAINTLSGNDRGAGKAYTKSVPGRESESVGGVPDRGIASQNGGGDSPAPE